MYKNIGVRIKYTQKGINKMQFKKLLMLGIVSVMSVSLLACGSKETEKQPETEQEVVVDDETTENTEEGTEENTETEESGEETDAVESTGSVDVLKAAWDLFEEDSKFMVMGGDAEAIVDGAPGAFNIEKAEDLGLSSTLCFPMSELDKIDEAASMVHGMLANNFTAGVFHMKDGEDAKALADKISEEMASTQWLCGVPEMKMIATVNDEYVVSMFGATDILSMFKEKLTEAHGETCVFVIEEAITE